MEDILDHRKIPLFILSAIMAYTTLSIQSQKAVASVEIHGIIDRICFAGFGLIWYLLKVIVPYPLSALHPFPKELSVYYYLGTAASVAGILFMALKSEAGITFLALAFISSICYWYCNSFQLAMQLWLNDTPMFRISAFSF